MRQICRRGADVRDLFPPRAFARISLPRQRNYKVPTKKKKNVAAGSTKPKNRTKHEGDDKERLAPGGGGLAPRAALPAATTTRTRTSPVYKRDPPAERAHIHQNTRVF
jgi:hypothetical protein